MNGEHMVSLQQSSLKPQDVVVCIKIQLENDRQTIQKLSNSLFISAGEVHGAIKRAQKSRLVTLESGIQRVSLPAFLEFLVFGLKYAFPAETGPAVRGMPTGIAAVKELNSRFAPTEALPYVWPSPEGKSTGIALAPLFPSVPKAAAQDPELYKALALIDAIREGAARERELAVKEIRIMLSV
jgi:hypothetical protein